MATTDISPAILHYYRGFHEKGVDAMDTNKKDQEPNVAWLLHLDRKVEDARRALDDLRAAGRTLTANRYAGRTLKGAAWELAQVVAAQVEQFNAGQGGPARGFTVGSLVVANGKATVNVSRKGAAHCAVTAEVPARSQEGGRHA